MKSNGTLVTSLWSARAGAATAMAISASVHTINILVVGFLIMASLSFVVQAFRPARGGPEGPHYTFAHAPADLKSALHVCNVFLVM